MSLYPVKCNGGRKWLNACTLILGPWFFTFTQCRVRHFLVPGQNEKINNLHKYSANNIFIKPEYVSVL